MPRYVIEREIPNIGKMTPVELQAISQKSRAALEKLGTGIQWIESFVTDDKSYCVYLAPNEDLILRHALLTGFPVNRISTVRSVISPATAEG